MEEGGQDEKGSSSAVERTRRGPPPGGPLHYSRQPKTPWRLVRHEIRTSSKLAGRLIGTTLRMPVAVRLFKLTMRHATLVWGTARQVSLSDT
jgi:hypothetical protein